MGVPYDQTRTLAGDLPDLKETMIPQDVDVNPNERKDVQALIKKQEAMSALKSAGNNFWYPSISLFAEQQYYQFGNFDPVVVANSGYENASFVGVRLKWNLFDGGASYAHEQQALQSEIVAESQTEKAKLSMHKDVDGWKRKFKYGVSLYKARLRALVEFQESVRLAEIGVKAGSRTHSEMLDAELDLFRARGGVVKAQTEAIEALGQLELAVGRRLWIAKDAI